ncbi:MAG: phage tail tube protein [Hydrogenoanaerobacterium sp.]
MAYEANEAINGLYGFVYDENGTELQSTQSFESQLEYEKEAIKQAGKFLDSHKVMGGSGSGTLTILKLDSRLQKKIAENPTAKYNYIGKLADPTAKGEEAIMYKGVSFDSVQLTKYELGALVEEEFPFTFDDWAYINSID